MTDRAEVVEIARRLIRFDTTNPPGRERACVDFLDGLLVEAGFETRRLARDPERPNLLTRLEGRGEAPPLLLYGHVDVVTAEGQTWTHPPFGGLVADGALWGRGALDMKGGVAMLVTALLRARREGLRPAGDVLLAVLSDEEDGGVHGARYLVEEHAGVFEGVRWAIGEFGGFPLRLGGRTFYPIQVTEKGICWLEARVTGPGGHGSFPRSGEGTMGRLGRLLTALEEHRPRHRCTPAVRATIEAMAEGSDPELAADLRALLTADTVEGAVRRLGPNAFFLEAVLRNTVNVTVVRAGEKVNVVPSEARVRIDARLVPGQDAASLLAELREAVGEGVEFRVLREDPAPESMDAALLPLLAGELTRADPEAVPVPFVLLGATDGRHFARLGIQTYGYLPMDLPGDFDFASTIHGPDERVPLSCLSFGVEVLGRVLERYPG